MIDEDTARAIDDGRQTVAAMLRTAQTHLQKVFIVFLVGFLGSFYFINLYVWDFLKARLLAEGASVIAVTPFDVILLQVKMALIVGGLIALPVLLYFAREPLRERGLIPNAPVARWKVAVLALFGLVLFAGGVAYAFGLLFPILFDFFARNAIRSGFTPTYSIVKWTQFIVILSLAMGLAAQLPLLMSAFTYAGIVQYRTFRDKWRHAFVAIAVLASVINGSPEPFSMMLVAIPMAALYVVGLLFSRFIQAARGAHAARDGARRGSGDPADIDLSTLDAAGVRAAPPEAFAEMTEEEALGHARTAMDEGDHDRAQAILDRFDEVEAAREGEASTGDGTTAPTAEAEAVPDGTTPDEGDDSDVVTRTTTGVVNAFSDDERSEDEIGGYFYDLQFIIGSLASKSFRIVALFLIVLAAVFTALYQGGIDVLRQDFLRRLPAFVDKDVVDIAVLHPVEALVFEMKVAAVVAFVTTIPLVLYYAWPALETRGFVSGSRGVLFTWGVTTFVSLVIGSVVGYAVVAPNVISWLAWDVINSDMIIKYRINSFGWLVFLTTIGVGLLGIVPSTMLLFHRGGLVPYRAMRGRWREVVVGIFTVTALAVPGGVFTMLLFSVPLIGAYFIGLGLLWLYTLGGRRSARSTGQRAD